MNKTKRKKKHGAKVVALSLTLSMALAACSSGGSDPSSSPSTQPSPSEQAGTGAETYENGLPKDEAVTLKVGFFLAGMGQEWFDHAVSTFKEKYPNVTFDILSSPTIGEIIGTKISADNDKEMFDLYNGSPPGGLATTTSLVQAGKLEPLDDLWDYPVMDADGKTFKEMAQEGTFDIAARISDKMYSLPLFGNGGGLFYNKKLFEEKGWNQSPQTWDEFVALLTQIKSDNVIPITFPGQHAYYLDYAFGPVKSFELAELNGNLDQFTDNFRNFKLPEFTSAENVERWNRIYELGKQGFFPKGIAALNHTQAQMQVLQGEAALVSTGVWVQNEMKEATPEGFEWGYMAVPFGSKPDDTKWMYQTPQSSFYIWANKPDLNKKWAKEFIVWMFNMDVQVLIGEKGGQLPLRKDYGDDEARLNGLPDAPKAMFQYVKDNNVKPENSLRVVTLTDPAKAQADKVMTEAVTEIVEGNLDPAKVLEEAEALLRKAIEAQK